MKDENKQAYSFTEKALQKGPSIKAPPQRRTRRGRGPERNPLRSHDPEDYRGSHRRPQEQRRGHKPRSTLQPGQEDEHGGPGGALHALLGGSLQGSQEKMPPKGLQEGGARTAGVRRPLRRVRRSS